MLQFIIITVLGIAITIFLAKGIVTFIPKKIQSLISVVLWILIIFLGYKVYAGIMSPINFNERKIVKYAKVIDNLKMVRDAEIAYKSITGNYTADGVALIRLIETAKFPILQTREIVVSVKKGSITVDEERKVIDTIGFDPVINHFKNRDYKNMLLVPGTNSKFDIKIGFVEKVEGLKVPVFLAQVDKSIVLEGEDISLIKQEKEQLGGDEIKGAFVSVGSLDDIVTNGNWPPLYDKAEQRAAKANKQ